VPLVIVTTARAAAGVPVTAETRHAPEAVIAGMTAAGAIVAVTTNDELNTALAGAPRNALRDRVSSYERARIVHFYYLNVTGDYIRAIDELERHRQTYPRDHRSYTGLGLAYMRLGQFEKAVEATRTSIRLDPQSPVSYLNLAQSLIRLGRYDEANQVITQSIEVAKIEAEGLRRFRYFLALIRGDAEVMRREVAALTGTPAEYLAFTLQSQTAIFSGRWQQAQELARRAVDAAAANGSKGPAGDLAADTALWAAILGQCARAAAWVRESQALDASSLVQPRVALALALCGEPRRAKASIDDVSARLPENTVMQAIWLPIVRAALEQQRGADAAAIELLKPVTRYQAAAQFWPQYLRGQSYLRLRQGHEAAAEFRSILDERGQHVTSILYPLAHLGLARAATMTGDAALARKAYDDFFALWKDADPGLLPLIEATAESRTLK
jgi:eukaryotic-like serine/threonine-protein kinase